jgi:methylglutaconyl-CoA hydratase
MTHTYETIRLETDPRGVAHLVLNRPEKHNAINAAMIGELTDAAKHLSIDSKTRVIVLSSSGNSFCAGADLAWMREQFGAARDARISEATNLSAMLRLIDELPKPIIAIVQGPTYGGGVGLTAVCDIVLAASEAKFALTETRLGLVPATIAPFLVARIGHANARRFALNAGTFTAEEARAVGLVSEVHTLHDLATAMERQLDLILAAAPGAIAATKQLLRNVAAGTISHSEAVTALADRWESEEARHGIESFFSKSRPPWAP